VVEVVEYLLLHKVQLHTALEELEVVVEVVMVVMVLQEQLILVVEVVDLEELVV
tara:strand:- start:115 stop:276 length:162 start_codon:yes stop_codon:yes gene_type:complete